MAAMTAPSLGIAIPCFAGHARVLERCLQSIARQTRLPDQCAIAFSECTVEQRARLDKLAGELPFPILLDTCFSVRNAAQNRNQAVALLDTDWVSFIDADDEMLPMRMAQVEQVILHSNTLCILHDTHMCRCTVAPMTVEERRALEDAHPKPYVSNPYVRQDTTPTTLRDLQRGPSIAPGHISLARQLLDEVSFDAHYRNPSATEANKYLWIGEDLRFLAAVLQRILPNQLAYLPNKLTIYHKIPKNGVSKHMN